MKLFILTLILLLSTNVFADFESVLEKFPKLPSSLSDTQIQDLASSDEDVHYYFNENGLSYTTKMLIPIAKLNTEFGYFLLTASTQQVTKNDRPHVSIYGYSTDKHGKLIEKNPFILTSGRFKDERYNALFWRDGKDFHFYTHTYDAFTDESTHRDMVYELTSKKMEYQKTNRSKPKDLPINNFDNNN